jgi:hypothetical protein
MKPWDTGILTSSLFVNETSASMSNQIFHFFYCGKKLNFNHFLAFLHLPESIFFKRVEESKATIS